MRHVGHLPRIMPDTCYLNEQQVLFLLTFVPLPSIECIECGGTARNSLCSIHSRISKLDVNYYTTLPTCRELRVLTSVHCPSCGRA